MCRPCEVIIELMNTWDISVLLVAGSLLKEAAPVNLLAYPGVNAWAREKSFQLILHFVNHAPIHNRRDDFHFLDLFGIDLENVARENHDIGEFARSDCALLIFLKLCEGGADDVSADRFFDGDPLLRNPTVRMLTV